MADVGTTVDLRNRRLGLRAGERIRVLLVEDDPGDAFLVQELLAEADAPFDVQVAQTHARRPAPLLREVALRPARPRAARRERAGRAAPACCRTPGGSRCAC